MTWLRQLRCVVFHQARWVEAHWAGRQRWLCPTCDVRVADADEFEALLARWGVPYDKDADEGGIRLTISQSSHSPKITGYTGFLTTFDFSPDGTFESVGAWE